MLDSPAKLIEMLQLQEALEVRTNGDNWREHDPNVTLAVHMECCEIIDHLGWKWWKAKPEYNEAQIHIELVDIWHFALMHNLMHIQNESGIEKLGNSLYDQLILAIKQAATLKEEVDIIDLVVSLGYHMIATRSFPLTSYVIACEMLGLSVDKLYQLYISKNVLNVFRQDHGYADGTYRKQWFFDGKSIEDNEALIIAVDRLVDAEMFSCEALANNLEIMYILD